mgnify:CR=1 FL=1
MDHLCKNPLKFILFIDDLTFSEDDPNFGTLKATLEGSIAARMRNTVIYATSNRRHLVKETSMTAATSTPTTPYRSASPCRSGSASPSPTAGRRKTSIWKSSTLWQNRTD